MKVAIKGRRYYIGKVVNGQPIGDEVGIAWGEDIVPKGEYLKRYKEDTGDKKAVCFGTETVYEVHEVPADVIVGYPVVENVD